MKIAIVNDALFAVEALRRLLRGAGGFELAWVARDGREAVERCSRDRPDLILMDLLMPEMNGVEATRQIMAASPCPVLIVTGDVTTNAALVFEAMGAGALDAVNTPLLRDNPGAGAGQELLAKIRNIRILNAGDAAVPVAAGRAVRAHHAPGAIPLVVIGASCGGPQALGRILGNLPRTFPAGIVIIQHVDACFADELAAWLAGQSALQVRSAVSGDRIAAGTALIAKTEGHLVMAPDRSLKYQVEPADTVYKPSIDVFFGSVAEHWDGPVTALLLTGMGRDGAHGLSLLRKAGAFTIAQDRASSAVYGMPKAAVEEGAAGTILHVEQIADLLLQRAATGAW